MKNFFIMVILSVFWVNISSIAYSEIDINIKELKKSLEKCADNSYIILTKEIDDSKYNYSNDPEYNQISIKLKEINNQRKKISYQSASKLKFWWDENPIPLRNDYTQTVTSSGKLDWSEFYEDLEKYEKDQKAVVNDLTKKQRELESEIRKLETKKELLMRKYTLNYIKDLTIAQKSKNVNGYLKYYKNCERMYMETPISFLLEWLV